MAFRNYILLFALVAGTIAGPINVQDGESKCATKCEASLSDSAKFQYIPGKTYIYKYEGTTETSLKGSSSQQTSIKIDATADIEVLSKCEFALKLSDVSLQENGQTSPNSNEFKQKLEHKPLRFAFQDGVIENVCSETGEDERVLNVKRAVLSTFQNSMSQLDKDGLFIETDVSGTCPTNYKSKSALFGGGVTITKSKDIIACTDRTGNITSVHSHSYNIPSKLQNAPLLQSTHECEQDIKSDKLQKTTCTEMLMFRPFSKDGNGAVTKATQTLTYSTYKSSTSVSQSAVQRRSSMLFHHLYDHSIDMNAKSDVIALLREICSEVSEDIQKDTPILFGDLISKMKRLGSDKMLEVYTAVNGDSICVSPRGKQFFYDAIPLVSTEASLTLVTKLILEKTVQGLEAEVWLTQLAFIPRPTAAMLSVVKPLLDDSAHHTRALLGITAMVHKYCEEHSDCHSNADVSAIVDVLNSNIGSNCMTSTKEERETMLVTLKGIGNAGDAFKSSSSIARCINNEDVDTEIRVAALQAFRRMPCTVSRDVAMTMYQSTVHDSELRIHAFLAVMTCPTESVLTKVRMMLSGEPVNQVGSFVWTYLENLKETSSPLKQELSSILDDAKMREDFNLDVRKFSRNLEKSYFSDYLNAGAQLESNLIWSQRSYIPRSAMLNITIEMFGDSINLIELGGRVQGLEKIVEKFLGPNGYFNKKNVDELMDNKRQTANYISPFDKSFHTPDDDITTSMYIKWFGNEVGFRQLDSDDWKELKSFNILDFLIKLAEPKKIDLTKNMQIMDSSLIVPTCIGLPMNLTVNGTATVSMDVDGNVDLRNIAASPRSFDINGHIKPSAAIVVSGMMAVDAIVSKSSMKMVSTMHSSTQLDGKITLQNGEIFSVHLNTPKEKMEVFHVQTEFFMNGLEMTMPEAATVYKKCTPAGMTKVIGMEMCVDVTLPTFHKDGLPLPPFTGPMNAQVFIEKKDTHTGYSFVAKLEKDQQEMGGVTYTKRVAHMSLDTPGSAVDRKLLMEAVFDPANMVASADLISPWKKFEWSASLNNTMTLKEASTKLVVDGDQTYAIDALVGINEMNVKTVWSPSFTITIPNKQPMSISGTLESGTTTTIAAVDLAIKNFIRKPITLTSALLKTKNGAGYDFTFNLKSEPLNSKVTTTVAIAPGNYNGQADVEYQLAGRPVHRFTAAGKFSDDSIGELMSYSLQAGLIPTEFPDYQFNVATSLEFTVNHIDTKFDLEVNRHKLYLAHKTIKEGTWEALKVTSSSEIKYPIMNVDMSAIMEHEHNSDLIKSSGIYTSSGKTVRSMINLDRSTQDQYTGEASLSYPGRELSMDVEMHQMVYGEKKIMVKTQWASDANSEASLTAVWKSGTTHEVTGDIKIPGHPVTFSVSVRPEIMDFMGQAQVSYNQNAYSVKSEYKVDPYKSLTSSGNWISPNRDMSYEIDTSYTEEKMAVMTEFSWEPTKKVTLNGEYNNRDTANMMSRDGKLSIVSPFGTHSFNNEFEMSSPNFGRISSEAIMNGEKSVMSARYNMGSGEFSLDTPYIRFGEVKAITLNFNHDDSHADATFTWAPSKTIVGEVKWSATKYSADFTTPFAVSKLGGSFELPTVGSPSAKVYWNNAEASLTVSYPDKNNGEFALTYPGHTVSGSFSQQGNMDMFTGEAEVMYDDMKFWNKVVFSAKGPYTLTVDATTPLAIKKISANFHHEGTMASFTNEVSLTWDSDNIRSTLEFSGKQAKLSVKTPWRDVLAQYFFNGNMESFKTNALVSWADDQEMSADVTFDMVKDLKASFSVSSPFYHTVSGSFDHTGEMNNFNNEMTLTWAPSSTFSATSKFSMINGITMEIDVTAPKKATLSLTHTGDINTWSNNAELTLENMQPVSVYSQFNMEKMDGKVGIKGLTFEKMQSAEWSVDSTKYQKKIDIMSTMTWNAKETIVTKMMLSMESGYAMTASLSTPFTETYSMSMTHKQDSKTLNNVASLQWAPTMKMTSELDISIVSGVEVKANMVTPWRQVSYTLNKHGNADEFLASSVFSWATDKQISTSLEFSQLSDIVMKWTMKTPFELAKDVTLSMTHSGKTITSFFNQLEADYNGNKAQLATGIDMKATSGEFKVITVNPWKSFNTNLKYNGVATDFTASVTFTMDQKTYSANSKFACTNGIDLTLDITPVVYKPVSFSAKLGQATNTAYLRWGDNKVISGTASLKYDQSLNTMDALVKFETPFADYESGEATIRHSGTMGAFRDTVVVSFNTKSATLTGGFSSTGNIEGDLTLTSPWYNCDGRFEHSGDMNSFSNSMHFTYAPGKTIRSSSKWSMSNAVSAEVSFEAPFKSFDATYNHDISLSGELTGSIDFTVDKTKMLHSDLKYLNAPSNIILEFSVESPWKSFNGKYTHVGTRTTKCEAEAEFTWDSQTVSAEWTVSLANGFSTEVAIHTPWRNFAGEVEHVISAGHFQNTVSVTYDVGKTIKLVTEFDMAPDFLIKSKFTSPFKNADILYRHSGTWENGACHLTGNYGDMPVTANLKWNAVSPYDLSFDVTSPWKNVKGAFQTNTDLTDLASGAMFEWGSEKIEATLQWSFSEMSGIRHDLSIKTPWRNMVSTFGWNGEWNDFESTAFVSWKDGMSVSAILSNKIGRGRAELITPWKTITANYQCSGSWEDFTSSSDVTWDVDQKISTSVSLNRNNGWESKLTVKSPWKDVETNANFIGDLTAFTSGFDFTWEAGKSISTSAKFSLQPILASWTFKSPTNDFSAEVKHSGELTDFENSAFVSWAPTKKIEVSSAFKMADSIVGRASVKSPFSSNIELSMEHTATSGELSFVNPWKNMKIQYTYTDQYNFEGMFTYDIMNYGYEIKTTWNNGVQSLVKVVTPATAYSVDVDHQGDMSTFRNSVEIKYSDETYKLVTNADVPKWKFSQSLETPIQGYENQDWSLSFTPTDSSYAARLVANHNADKYEVNADIQMAKQGDKMVITTMYELLTPIEGYKSNKITEEIEFSTQLIHYKINGYMGSPSNSKHFEIYSMLTTESPSVVSYLKTNVGSDRESEISFNFSLKDGHLTSDFNADVAAYPTVNHQWKLDVTHSNTNGAINHEASLDLTSTMGKAKFMWNFGANSNMCESGFSFNHNGVDQVTISHKANWTSDLRKMTVEESVKVPSYDLLKDGSIRFTYDFTQPKSTMSFTMFNDPTTPFDFKAEYDTVSVMAEFTTPFESAKTGKATIAINKEQPPWTVKVEAQLNQQSVTAEARLSYTSPRVFDLTASFTSQIPMFDNMMMSVSSSSTQDQWKPHASFQWASHKKIDMGATISLTNPYKATIEFSSPFESWRSVSMDAMFDNSLPNKLTSTFELNCNQHSQKLTSKLDLDMNAKSFMFTLATPWETVRSFEITSVTRPRINSYIKLNGDSLFAVSGNAKLESLTNHDIDVSLTYPFLNKYMRVKINNDLELSGDNSMQSHMDLEYMKDQEICFKFDYKSGSPSTMSVSMETPFEKFEKMSYSVMYSGSPQSWTENTEVECYYGKVTTRTTFSMENGLASHQTVTGEMKNGFEDFNYQKDLVFTGDANKFDLQANFISSFTPTLKFETSWQYNPIVLSLKTTLNKYSLDYTHTGPATDFTCTWKVAVPTSSGGWFSSDDIDEWNGTWSFKKSDAIIFSTDITCPHDNNLKLAFNVDPMKGSFDSEWAIDDETWKYSASYSRSATPFRYEATTDLEVNSHKLSSSFVLTENSINFPITYDNTQVFAIRASNLLNADKEYVPTIHLVIDGEAYDFDGLFKNEGEGLIRDFKLHMNGPRGDMYNAVKFQVEFKTQSAQLVPGDFKLYLSGIETDSQTETVWMDMTAGWGNDHALVTFIEPHPMRYSIDFSVSTSGQTGTIEANWDTTKMGRNMKMDFTNKFSSSSQMFESDISVDIIYAGISRGFTSVMGWQKDQKCNHKLVFDYNGKQIGFDLMRSKTDGLSLEVITQWRNVKVTWNVETPSDSVQQATLGFYWDSARDMSKKLLGTSRLEKTDVNTYKWTTAFSHPALATDLVITDSISYDTSNVVAALNKRISFSSDKTKDVIVDFILEKSGKWGVEVRQDFNKIDCRIGSEFSDSGMTSSMVYKATDGMLKQFGFATEYDSYSKTMTMQLVTPMKTMKLETMATSDSYTMTLTVDGKKYTTSFTFQPENSYMLVKMGGQKTDMELEAKMLAGGYQVQLLKIDDSKTTIEGLASISMNESKIVNGKLYWNPTLVSEIQSKIAVLRSALKDTVKTMYTAASSELSNKGASMNLGSDFDSIMPHHQSELALLKSDMDAARMTMENAYNTDVLFMKSIDESTRGYISWVIEVCDAAMYITVEVYENAVERMVSCLEVLNLDFTKYMAKIEMRVQELVTEWNEQTEDIREAWKVVSEWLQVYIDRVAEFISEHPTVQTLKSVHTIIMSKFTAFLDAIYSRVVVFANAQMYTDMVYNVHSYVNDRLPSSILTVMSDSLMYKLKFYYDYYDVSDNMKVFLTHARNIGIEYMNDYLTHYIDDVINEFKWVAYDLSTGRIEFNFVIPTTLDKINMVAFNSGMRQTLTNFVAHMRKYHYNVREMFYMYKPNSFRQIMPPFDAQAIIAGQHIRTFDKRHYDFSSNKCSYLLARDFHDGNFTIFVNYVGSDQSITVHSNGKTVDIQMDNSVKLDGTKIELPYQFFNTTITRMGAKIILTSALGMEIACDNINGLCTVDMNGHYFAKTAGLLGTYNYEPSDDFTTSSNTNTSDVLEFANSWTSSCNGMNTAKMFSEIKDTKEYKACAALFKDSDSPMSSCFEIVNPDQAFHKCINDMGTDVTLTSTNGPCKASVLYKAECQFAGVVMDMPAQCVECQVGENTITQGETSQITQPLLAADIVFIVEEKMCNYEIDTKLPTLAKLIESSLAANSYSDVRFGLVGFGGEHVHSPSHSHTMDSKMLAARTELSLGTDALQFSSTGTNKDVFDAIEFATGYPFRAGANKVMIVLPCSDCSESEHSYRSIAEKLAAEEITVHVINNFVYEITVDGKNPPTNYLFGIDNYAVYSTRDVRSFKGTTRLYPIVSKPTDSCSTLALQTDGTVFDQNMMTKTRSTVIKNFQTVFANRLAQTTTPSKCTSCTCEYNPMFGMSRTVCHKC